MILDQPQELHRDTKQNLTSLHVCVQSRRKDGVPIVVFGAGTQLVSSASCTRLALRGRVDDSDNSTLFTRIGSVSTRRIVRHDLTRQTHFTRGENVAAIGVIKDYWTGAPRVHVSHMNGKSVCSRVHIRIPEQTIPDME